MKGPALFIAQFLGEKPPFNSIPTISRWASDLGFQALQIPTNRPEIFDLKLAASSEMYCNEYKSVLAGHNLEISELSTHLQGQMLAVHPAYRKVFESFAPESLKGNYKAQQTWAKGQLLLAAKASENLGLTSHATFSGSFLWPYIYPWPQRPQGLVEEGFKKLGENWLPILNAFDEAGVDVCFELHPGEDLHDGISFERFLDNTGHHQRANILYDPSHLHLQQMDYLGFIDCYAERIKAFHVKDAEYTPSAKSGVYGGYQDWIDRPGRFRSLGDGQVDFKSIFSKLIQLNFPGWAVLEWECCLKSPEQGAKEGAEFIRKHIFERTQQAFDDFSAVGDSKNIISDLLG